MTAFGRGEAQADGYRFAVELRSLNHRFCDIRVKLPKKYREFEEVIKKHLSAHFSRGRIEVGVLTDEALERVRDLLLVFRDIFVLQEDQESLKKARQVLEMALEQAVTDCLQMRADEGAAIENDFRKRLQELATLTSEIEARVPKVVEEVRDRLQKRIQELLGQTELDESRLAQEVAYFADKSDITEEVVRFQSHIQQFRDLLGANGPRGRQLEFLLQEMLREINTIGSKTNDLEIAQKVILVKTELEKLREQLQNVE
jgi:uncharacterized protein (TIGR00255 family)